MNSGQPAPRQAAGTGSALAPRPTAAGKDCNMDKFSFSTFGVARTLMALAVFFCHVFEPFNNFGFLFVGVFFFMSGFGLELRSRRLSALTRLIPYLGIFAAFSVLYYAIFRVFPYPSSWFFVVYFVVMVLYRLSSNIYVLTGLFVAFAVFLAVLGFNWVWGASYGGFLLGVFVARYPRYFTLSNCFFFFLVNFIVLVYVGPFFWGFLPLFTWLVLKFSSLSFMRPVAFLGQYTLLFYCSHCLFLGLLGATWTLGGSPSLHTVAFALFLTCVFSYVMKEGIFIKR